MIKCFASDNFRQSIMEKLCTKSFLRSVLPLVFPKFLEELPKFAFCMAGRVVPINSKHLRDFLKIF